MSPAASMVTRTASQRTSPGGPGVQAFGSDCNYLQPRAPRPAEGPAAPDPPRLQVRVGQPPAGELAPGPFVGLLELRGAGEPRTDAVAEIGGGGQRLRPVEALVADARH